MKISLIEFSVENFKIFKERATFSMHARKSKHTFPSMGENLLKTSLIYGPNASGKSSLLEALTILRAGVVYSANNPEGTTLPYHPFALGVDKNKPISFELSFSLDDKIFQYSFSFMDKEIISEKFLEISISGSKKEHFSRSYQEINVFLEFEKSKDVAEKMTRKEVLFLSAASQWKNDLAMKVVNSFKKSINIISGIESDEYRGYTVNLFKEEGKRKEKIIKFLKQADFFIEDGFVETRDLPEEVKKKISLLPNIKNIPDKMHTVFLSHNVFDDKGEVIGSKALNLQHESTGTQRFFDVLGPIVDTLEYGKVLFIDELDNSLHPFLTKFIINLFEEHNPKNAQLVVTTHDSNLLASTDLRKEHFWFTEKNKFGAAKLYSLFEFNDHNDKLRNDVDFSKKYFEGRFGALPYIKL